MNKLSIGAQACVMVLFAGAPAFAIAQAAQQFNAWESYYTSPDLVYCDIKLPSIRDMRNTPSYPNPANFLFSRVWSSSDPNKYMEVGVKEFQAGLSSSTSFLDFYYMYGSTPNYMFIDFADSYAGQYCTTRIEINGSGSMYAHVTAGGNSFPGSWTNVGATSVKYYEAGVRSWPGSTTASGGVNIKNAYYSPTGTATTYWFPGSITSPVPTNHWIVNNASDTTSGYNVGATTNSGWLYNGSTNFYAETYHY